MIYLSIPGFETYKFRDLRMSGKRINNSDGDDDDENDYDFDDDVGNDDGDGDNDDERIEWADNIY